MTTTPAKTPPKPRTLICACCGRCTENPYQQWWNQDQGFGICSSCSEWIIGKGTMNVASFIDTYGKPDVHRARTFKEQPEPEVYP